MEEGAPAFWPTFVSRDGTEMVMLYDAEKFIDNYSKVKKPSAKLKNVLKEIQFDNNPVAIIAKLKWLCCIFVFQKECNRSKVMLNQ